MEILHRSIHLSGHLGLEGVFFKVRGKVADRLHGEDGGGGEFAFEAHLAEEVAVIVQGTQQTEIAKVEVGVVVLDVELVQQHLPMARLHLSGQVMHVPSALLRNPDMVRVADDFPVLDEQVRCMDVRHDVQVVPVDDVVGHGLPPLVGLPLGGGMVEHPETEAFDIHPGGLQKVAEILLGFSGRLQAQDARQVAGGFFTGGAGLRDEVETASFQPQAADGDPFLVEEPLQGEPGRQGADAQERVLCREESAPVGMPVLHDHVPEDEGVEGFHGDAAHLDVRVDVPGETLHRLPGEIGLDSGGLDGDDEGQQQQEQHCQHAERYAKTLLHQSTNLRIKSVSLQS